MILMCWTSSTAAQPSAAEPEGIIQLQSLLQVRYAQTFAAASDDARPGFAARDDEYLHRHDGIDLRRAYLRMLLEPAPWLQAKTVLNFAELEHGDPEDVVRQAYVQLTPFPAHAELAVGMFKLPYSIMKLTSASDLPVADKGASAALVTHLGFAGRDIGARIRVTPLAKKKQLRLSVGAYRGHAHDENAALFGATAARVELRPAKGVSFGASVVHHVSDVTYLRPLETSDKQLLPDPPDPLYPYQKRWSKGTAWGADAAYRHKKHWLVRAEGLYGDRVDSDERYGARAFFGAFALFELRVPLGAITLQPCVRAEWLDADLDRDVGTRRSYTLALQLIFDRHVRLLFDATHVDVEDDSPLLHPPRPLPATPYIERDHTRATAQLQVEI